MSIIAVGSAKASPGATDLSVGLGLSWAPNTGRQAVLIEADGDGGVVAARYGLTLTPSLVELSGVAQHDLTPNRLKDNCQLLAGQLPALVAPGSGEATSVVLEPLAQRLIDGFANQDDIDVVVDVGRVRSHSPAAELIKHCDLLVLVARPQFDQLVPLVHRVRQVTAQGVPTALVCVGDRPYPPAEMAKAAQLDLLGVMAYEPRVVQILGCGLPENRRHRQILLWRTLAELVNRIHSRLHAPTTSQVAAASRARQFNSAHLNEVKGFQP